MNPAFRQLLRKDLVHTWPTVLTLFAIFTGLVLYFVGRGDADTIVYVSMMMLMPGLLVLPVLFMWRSFALREWQSEQMYFLLSLPIPGQYVLGSRLLLVLLEFILYTVTFFTGMGILLSFLGPVLMADGSVADWLDWVALIVRWSLLAVLLGTTLATTAQFSFLVGRSVRRASLLVAALLYVSSLWILYRIATGVSNLIETSLTFRFWIPIPDADGGMLIPVLIDLLPILLAFLLSSLFFFLGVRIFEERVEV